MSLPNSFSNVITKSITCNLLSKYEWIDVSKILINLLPFTLGEIDSNVTSILIPILSINMVDYTIFNFSRFTLLEELEIGNDCFMYVNSFMIDGLNELKSLKIGMNSFTTNKFGYGNNPSRFFQISNCDELESIEIGQYSFSDYGGLFELKNLPKLSTIEIGEIGSDSSNFYYSSFEIKGIIDDDITNE